MAETASPRELLVQAAFEDRSKPVALAKIQRARALASAPRNTRASQAAELMVKLTVKSR